MWVRYIAYWIGAFELSIAGEETETDIADITVMFLVAGADPFMSLAPEAEPLGRVPGWVLTFLLDQANQERLTVPREHILQAIEVLKAQERCIPRVAFETGPNRPTATEVEEEVGDQGELDNMPNENGQQVDIHMADIAQPLTPAASHVGARKRERSISQNEERPSGSEKRVKIQPSV